jgi:ribosomal protein L37E
MAEVILMATSMIDSAWTCDRCGHENGPMRDVFCDNCGNRRPGW